MFESRPELLSSPNIPKPLHGLNPRTIMGRSAWDVKRQEVYKSTEFHCAACGVHKTRAKKHKWLEAHEIFDIDYKKQRATIVEIVPLCHFCHAFIHSGLTRVRARNKDITAQEVRDIMQHGVSVLESCDGAVFLGTSELCQLVGVDCSMLPSIPLASHGGSWGGWRMVWSGKEYRGKFPTFKHWQRHYS